MLSVPKVLITAVILLSFMEPIEDKYDVVEFYAGRARIARAARGAGLTAAALDVVFHSYPQVFDITSASGFALLAYRT